MRIGHQVSIRVVLTLEAKLCFFMNSDNYIATITLELRQANLTLIAYASSEGSGEPAHPHSLATTSAARSYKQ